MPRAVIASRLALAAVVIAGLIMMLRPLPPGAWTEDWFDGADKLFHLVFFALLWGLGVQARLARGWVLAAALLLFGVGIEASQAWFTSTRSASLADMLADGVGLLLGAAVLRWVLRGQPKEYRR